MRFPWLAVPAALGLVAAAAPPLSFEPAVFFAAGAGVPWSIRTADLNADGRPDIATADAGQLGWAGVSVLFDTTAAGATTPTFSTATRLRSGVVTTGVAFADFNADGTTDIAAANTGTAFVNGVSVFLNHTAPRSTSGSFAGPTGFAAGGGASQIATADVNADGRPDIVVGNFADPFVAGVSVLLNTTSPGAAKPAFSGPTFFTEGWGSEGIGIADLNADGRPDVIIGNTISSQVSVLMNTTSKAASRPSFAPAKNFFAPLATGIGIGDFDGDGRPDIAAASTVSSPQAGVVVLTNKTPVGASSPVLSYAGVFGTGYTAEDIAVGDYDSDGRPDLAICNDGSVAGVPSGVSVLLNTTSGAAVTFAPQQLFAAGTATNSIATADFNADHRPDLATGNVFSAGGENAVSVLLNSTP